MSKDERACANSDPITACEWQWNGVLWVCQTCGEADDMRDPPPVDLRAEYEDYAADCREYGVRK